MTDVVDSCIPGATISRGSGRVGRDVFRAERADADTALHLRFFFFFFCLMCSSLKVPGLSDGRSLTTSQLGWHWSG